MDPAPEHQENTIEQEIIRGQFVFWYEMTKKRGKYDSLNDYQTYKFTYDRRGESDSLFTFDRVRILILPKQEKLEDYAIIDVPIAPTEANEKWTEIQIDPKDPYRPKFAYFTDINHVFYYTEQINIYLSSLGRAYQQSEYTEVLGIRNKMEAAQSKLKIFPPNIEEAVKLNEDPSETLTEKTQPLNGQNLERLRFLFEQARLGNIFE